MKKGLKSVLENNKHSAYILDEQGNETQITAAMIRSACYQLLKQCRKIKA